MSSTSLRAVGYDAGRQKLEVQFLANSVYQYSGVPQDVYEGLLSAPSKGRYFARYIKGRYRYVRIR